MVKAQPTGERGVSAADTMEQGDGCGGWAELEGPSQPLIGRSQAGAVQKETTSRSHVNLDRRRKTRTRRNELIHRRETLFVAQARFSFA
jgi:hypothetical protein